MKTETKPNSRERMCSNGKSSPDRSIAHPKEHRDIYIKRFSLRCGVVGVIFQDTRTCSLAYRRITCFSDT